MAVVYLAKDRSYRNIKLNDRHYRNELVVNGYHDKVRKKRPIYRSFYVNEFDVKNGWQICRIFETTPTSCIEIERYYTRGVDEFYVYRLGCFYNQSAGLMKVNYYSEFKERKDAKVAYWTDKIIKRKVLPEYKFILQNDIIKGFSIDRIFTFYYCNNLFESCYKINKKLMFSILRSYYYGEAWRTLSKYKRQFELITKWKYKIPVKDIKIYFDYLKNLEDLNLDLRSPKYLCPKNLHTAHNKCIEKIMKLKEKNKLEKLLPDIKRYENLMMNFNDTLKDGIKIIPLKTVNDVKREGEIQKHCIFANNYFTKKDVVLFTSENEKGEKLETIEYNLQKNKVVQCYGYRNNFTPMHYKIIEIVNELLSKNKYVIRKMSE